MSIRLMMVFNLVAVLLAGSAFAATTELTPTGTTSESRYVDGYLTFGYSSSDRIYDNSGALVLESDNTADHYIELRSNDNDYGLILRQDVSDGSKWANIETNTDKLLLGFENNYGGLTISEQECVRIDASGGTCSLSEGLQIDGHIKVNGSTSNRIYDKNGVMIMELSPKDVASYGTEGAELAVYNDVWVQNRLEVGEFWDRTPYPPDVDEAYAAVLSMSRLPKEEYDPDDTSKQLDHSSLHPFISGGNGQGSARNLSATVSAQNEVIKDLIARIDALEGQLKVLTQSKSE